MSSKRPEDESQSDGAAAERRVQTIVEEALALGASRKPVVLEDVKPMLAETAPQPFSRPDWIYEVKYDGFRLLLALKDDVPRLGYRSGADSTALFPEVLAALRELPCRQLLLDGEVVVHDDDGKPSFNRLQNRTQLQRPQDIERAAAALPAVVHVFDLLALEGVDLRRLPLVSRKRLLRALLPKSGVLRYADHVEARGVEMFAEAKRLGLEGVMAKDGRSPYRSGRSADWLKLRVDRSDDFVVIGWTAPRRSRSGFGALHLAQLADGEGRLIYAGRVGSGFDEKLLVRIRAELEPHQTARPKMLGARPDAVATKWTAPRLVCEVKYQDWPADGVLRFPVFLRLREDKSPHECRHAPLANSASLPPADDLQPRVVLGSRETGPSSPSPSSPTSSAPDYTTGELADYYRQVAALLLPYLQDRPIALGRQLPRADGDRRPSEPLDATAAGLRTVRLWSAQARSEIEHVVCEDVAALVRAVELGWGPLHVWASRLQTPKAPDWCSLELDGTHAPFAQVVQLALALRALCDELGVAVYAKTSGAAGMQLLVPLGRRYSYGQARQLAAILARLVADEHPTLVATETERATAGEPGRVRIDHSGNGAGHLVVAPFSVCAGPGALVATPLDWAEVHEGLLPGSHTLKSVPERLGRDPMRGVLTESCDLQEVLLGLTRRLGR
jgi:bifunctional non-homologous end joining protein LigD